MFTVITAKRRAQERMIAQKGLYYAAAAATAISGVLHLIIATYRHILHRSRIGPALLGSAHDKEMGATMVLWWHRRDSSADNTFCDNKNAWQPDHWKRRSGQLHGNRC